MRRAFLIASQLLSVGSVACNTFDDSPRSKEPPLPQPTFLGTPPTFAPPTFTPPPPTAPSLAPLPPCSVHVDNDGDGVTVSDVSGCDQSFAPFVDPSLEDCDDFDATRSKAVAYGQDMDEDGFGGYLVGWLCEGTVYEGTVANTLDCDDYDAALHLYQYVDRDQDGQGALSAYGVCVASDESGFAPEPLDCDDRDPKRYDGAPGEVAYDDIDTDCNDADVPWFPISSPDELGTFEQGPWCEDGVLAVTAVGQTPGPSPLLTLQIVNVGTEPVDDASVVVYVIGLDRTVADTMVFGIPELEPGDVYLMPALGEGRYQASISYEPLGVDTETRETGLRASGFDAGAASSERESGSADASSSVDGDSAAPVVELPAPEFGGSRCRLLSAPLPLVNEFNEQTPI